MERLRAAIDKARAAREGETARAPREGEAAPVRTPASPPPPSAPPLPPRPEPSRRSGPSGDAAAEARLRAAWDGLEDFEPTLRQMERTRIVSARGANRASREAVAFDRLRTRITQEMRAQGWKRLAITSPGPACGKSTLALNLGFAFARRDDERTVLCEVDLRRPSLARILGLPGRRDFAEVLMSREAFADHAVRVADGLAVATVRGPRSRSSELLQSRGAAAALDAIEAEYDPSIMLFDTAPALAIDDTMGFLDRVDCVLIVAAAGKTTVAEIDACEREVAARSRVLGVVLNKCEFDDEPGKYDYYD
jgi:Mrp family chromosome partitioning ATPase